MTNEDFKAFYKYYFDEKVGQKGSRFSPMFAWKQHGRRLLLNIVKGNA